MSVFTEPELDYLRGARLARIATVGPDGQPHVVPVTFQYNPDEDAIDVGGIAFGASKKWRDAQRNPRMTFLLDESDGRSAKAIEVRGTAEPHEAGGQSINPRFPKFAPQFLRLRPRRIVSWGIAAEESGRDFRPYARDV
jgi:pyridoxamine 5'-phosphate oxidase family protein